MIARIAAAACFLFPAIAPASHGDSGHRGAGEIVPSAPAQDGPPQRRAGRRVAVRHSVAAR